MVVGWVTIRKDIVTDLQSRRVLIVSVAFVWVPLRRLRHRLEREPSKEPPSGM